MSLSKAQRQHLERRLLEERARVQRSLGRSLEERSRASEQERSGDVSLMPTHAADLGSDAMQAELEASNATRESRELAAIEDALDTLRHRPEVYGICADTGREIPFERLDLIPWARTCRAAGA